MAGQVATVSRRHPLAYVAVGIAGGILGGLLGVGGGVVMVPLMVTMLAVPQHLAHGTSLAIVILSALVSAVRYAQHGFLPTDAVLLAAELAVGAIFGANVGARIMHRLPARRLRQVFGVFMLVVGLRMVIGLDSGAAAVLDWQTTAPLLFGVIAVGIGFVIGILSGMLGVGGGVFMVPIMALLMAVPQHIAQGISLAVIVPTAVSGGLAHYRRGNVSGQLALWIGAGAVVAALVGSQIAASIQSAILHQLFGVLLAATGIRMLIQRK